MSALKEIIKESGLKYKQVAGLCNCTTSRVSVDASYEKISAEKAMAYARALNIDPARLRPDIFKPGETIFKEANNGQ